MATIASEIRNGARHWWVLLLRGLLLLIVGFFIFRYPVASYVTLSIFFGIIIFITGIVELFHAFANRNTRGWGWRLFTGIIDLVLGIMLMANIGASMLVLPYMVGFWFLLRGISMLSFSGIVKEGGNTAWLVIGGIVLIIFALLIMFNPLFGAMTIVTWTGIAFIIAGIFNIILALRLRNINNRLGSAT